MQPHDVFTPDSNLRPLPHLHVEVQVREEASLSKAQAQGATKSGEDPLVPTLAEQIKGLEAEKALLEERVKRLSVLEVGKPPPAKFGAASRPSSKVGPRTLPWQLCTSLRLGSNLSVVGHLVRRRSPGASE